MISTLSNTFSGIARMDQQKAAKCLWYLVLLAALVVFSSHAFASADGVLNSLNQWLEDELNGSVGLFLGLIAFVMGIIGSIATRSAPPLFWGLGVGVLLGTLLEIITARFGVGMPITAAMSSLGVF